jgi:hypothetical protein
MTPASLPAAAPSPGRTPKGGRCGALRERPAHDGARRRSLAGLLAALLVGLLAFAPAAALAAVSVTRFSSSERFALAQFFAVSADGCETLSLQIVANDRASPPDSPAEPPPTLRAELVLFNACTGEFHLATGSTASASVDIRHDLRRATATGTLVLVDESGALHTLQVDLRWTGGALTADRTRMVESSPCSRTFVRVRSAVRDASSVTGSLVLDGVDLLAGGGTMAPGIGGFIASGTGSSIEIVRAC